MEELKSGDVTAFVSQNPPKLADHIQLVVAQNGQGLVLEFRSMVPSCFSPQPNATEVQFQVEDVMKIEPFSRIYMSNQLVLQLQQLLENQRNQQQSMSVA